MQGENGEQIILITYAIGDLGFLQQQDCIAFPIYNSDAPDSEESEGHDSDKDIL